MEPYELRYQRERLRYEQDWDDRFGSEQLPPIRREHTSQAPMPPYVPPARPRIEAVLAALADAGYPERDTIYHRGRRYFSWQQGRVKRYGEGYYLEGEHQVREARVRFALLVAGGQGRFVNAEVPEAEYGVFYQEFIHEQSLAESMESLAARLGLDLQGGAPPS